ncbi:MAG: acyl carrier protein [Clostridia bacterium]
MKTFERVVKILKNCSGCDTVSRASSLEEDLALDSLGMVMMLIALEEEFGIELDASDLDPFALHTAGDIADLAEKYLAEEQEAQHG